MWPIVVENEIKDKGDTMTADMELIQYAKRHCTKEMQKYLFLNRHRLRPLIDDIWHWEHIDEELASATRSRLQGLVAAAHTPCRCNGEWIASVVQCFLANGTPVAELCKDVKQLLTEGRSETSPVVVLAGAKGGEGKSFFLKPLKDIYGSDQVFNSPGTGNFPLIDLPGKKVAFLDDWRFNENILPFSVQCLWYDGSDLPISRPQNQRGVTGHIVYKGTAPIFATTRLDHLEWLEKLAEVNPNTGEPASAEASMLWRRLKVYPFRQRMPKPATHIKYCGCCFARLILEQTA